MWLFPAVRLTVFKWKKQQQQHVLPRYLSNGPLMVNVISRFIYLKKKKNLNSIIVFHYICKNCRTLLKCICFTSLVQGFAQCLLSFAQQSVKSKQGTLSLFESAVSSYQRVAFWKGKRLEAVRACLCVCENDTSAVGGVLGAKQSLKKRDTLRKLDNDSDYEVTKTAATFKASWLWLGEHVEGTSPDIEH